jgi:ubiquinone/menaquinone biosynthesis C-methylase UbiE
MTVRDFMGNVFTHMDLFEEIARYRKDGRVLEVGVGTGSMSIFLSWLGYRVTAVDNSPEVLNTARRNSAAFHGHHVQFVEADAFKPPFVDDSFDVAFHQGLLEHFSDGDIHKLLSEQLRVAPIAVARMPNHAYPRRDFGDERLIREAGWETILSPFHQVTSRSYFPQPARRWRPSEPIMYLATVARSSPEADSRSGGTPSPGT